MTQPAHWAAPVMARRPAGDYVVVTVAARSGAGARPGHYASVSIGGAESARIMRRPLWIADTSAGGRHGATMDVVVDPGEAGGAWIAAQPASATIDTMAPLGRPFSLPSQPVTCLLIGIGAANAALVALAQDLVQRGCRVSFLLLGERPPFGVLAARRIAAHVTEQPHGSAAAAVTAALSGTDVVYSAGPAADLASVAAVVGGAGVLHQAAIHQDLVCGSGTCTACALPVSGRDGVTRMVRCCTEGPVFQAELVRWNDLGTVPGDCLGAPIAGES